MYNNTGNKIKNYAKNMATTEIIFCIVVAIIFIFIAFKAKTAFGFFGFLGGSLIVGIGGSLLAWSKFLFLAGYGELIEETKKAADRVEDIRDILRENYKKSPDVDEFCLSSKPFPIKEEKHCAYCDTKTDDLISRLCSDCNKLLYDSIIVECPNCNRYHHKDNKCKCQFW